MIQPVTIHCPVCGKTSELYLSVSPSMIVLNCPGCSTPLMYDGHTTDLSSSEPALSPTTHHEAALSAQCHAQHSATGHRSIRPDTVISHDDIVDLRIDLAGCRTVDEFISRI